MNHLTKKQTAELELCKTRGFITYRGKKLPPFHNAYYAWCMASPKPFVRIHKQTKYGSISLDMSCSRHIDLQGKHELRSFMEKWGLFPKEWNALPGDIPQVPLPIIETMALELHQLISGVLQRLEKAA